MQTKKAEEKGIDKGKAKTEVRKAETNTMHQQMDEDIEKVSSTLNNMAKARNTTGFWRTWPNAVERSIMEHNEVDKDAIKRSSGRGEVKLIKKCPEQRKEGKDPRSRWDKKAKKQLSQARRCEHMAYRLQILEQVEGQEKAEHTTS